MTISKFAYPLLQRIKCYRNTIKNSVPDFSHLRIKKRNSSMTYSPTLMTEYMEAVSDPKEEVMSFDYICEESIFIKTFRILKRDTR